MQAIARERSRMKLNAIVGNAVQIVDDKGTNLPLLNEILALERGLDDDS